MALPLSLSVRTESWPIAGAFSISRGAKTEAQVVVAELSDGRHSGRGECVPYARYEETVAGVMAALGAIGNRLALGLDRKALQQAMPAGAARNALDCAFWDLEAKRAAKPVHALVGLPAPQPLTTAYTISLGTPETMAEAARAASARKLLKIKLGGAGDPERIAAVRAAAPQSELIVDANEGWTAGNLAANLAACAAAGVTLVEQPLAGRRRRGACIDPAADPGLRRRKRARPRRPRLARRPLRRGQHQARQDRRPDRGAGHGGGGRASRLSHHGRLHGRHLAGHGAGAFCWRSGPAWSISTGRCFWRRIARTGYATRAAWFIRRRPRCGGRA